jgi:D-alanyl-D-alanine carboxypeptidase (penicillin-binding protein 5/6)
LSATAQRDGLGLIAVVMGSSTSQERFAACKSLLDYGFANYALVSPELTGEHKIPVRLGLADTVTAVPAEDTRLLIDKSQKNSITTEVVLDETVTAPVSKGQRLGTLTVKAGDKVLAQVPMVAQEGVSRLSWSDLFWQILQALVMSKEG